MYRLFFINNKEKINYTWFFKLLLYTLAYPACLLRTLYNCQITSNMTSPYTRDRWMSPTMKVGYHRTLKPADLFPICDEFKSGVVMQQLKTLFLIFI